MSYCHSLSLQNFRSYEGTGLQSLSSGLIVLTGPNGAGKTNILEALSLLSPGRGLRGARALELQRNSSPHPWGVSVKIHDRYGIENTIATGLMARNERRTIRINGAEAKSQGAMTDYISCLWLTPQMDRLFLDGAAERRRFLDRMIYSFDPAHAGRLTRYENALRQRSRLLQDGKKLDPVWLTGLEKQMAETGIAIAAARLDFVERLAHLHSQHNHEEERYFPSAGLSIKGTIENFLQKMPAIEVEQSFLYQLEQARNDDAIKGGAATGPHKSDLSVLYKSKNMAAANCSTGEQKALLIGLVLAHARMIRMERQQVPVLLLDEIAAHLDDKRREALFDRLSSLGGQVWMTGTEARSFQSIDKKAQFFRIDSGNILPVNQPEKSSRILSSTH